MLILTPTSVTFATKPISDVARIAIDRRAAKLAIEWSDLGRYATFADVPEQEVRVRIEQTPTPTDLAQPKPGDLGQLIFTAAANQGGVQRTRITLTAVVTSIKHDLDQSGPGKRTLELIAISSSGTTDPVQLEEE
jgi:hypothetical protein